MKSLVLVVFEIVFFVLLIVFTCLMVNIFAVPDVEYVGEGRLLAPGTYLLKSRDLSLLESVEADVVELPCGGAWFGWVEIYDELEWPGLAWRFPEREDPDAVLGFCGNLQQARIGKARAGDGIRCLGVDHWNDGNGPVSVYVNPPGTDQFEVLLNFPAGSDEPCIGKARISGKFEGEADLYLIGDGSSLWWCDVLGSTPTPTGTVPPTVPPTAITETPMPKAILFLPIGGK